LPLVRCGVARLYRWHGGEPWRIALALIVDAFDGELPAELHAAFTEVPARDLTAVRALLESSAPMPRARGVGRYFDAFGALFLGRTQASFEGQVALEWNQAADPRVTRAYRYDVAMVADCLEIDVRQTVRDAVADRIKGEPPAAIAAAFHNTIAQATADEHVRRRHSTARVRPCRQRGDGAARGFERVAMTELL
jgi:hydrogenase maturation protein HypF